MTHGPQSVLRFWESPGVTGRKVGLNEATGERTGGAPDGRPLVRGPRSPRLSETRASM